jgi:hypothetical protein
MASENIFDIKETASPITYDSSEVFGDPVLILTAARLCWKIIPSTHTASIAAIAAQRTVRFIEIPFSRG